ncbi:MAG: VWA domain-containing protein [Armatimonadota bacterium]|nr:VWA domain-containing protein [Armatimonadota bacterium]
MRAPFVWPAVLWLLLLVPALGLLYRRARRRAPAGPVLVPHVGMLRAAAAHARPGRQHLAAVLFLTALVLVLVALARPQVPLPVPADRAAIVLAIDSSGSMRSTDVLPNRLAAAQEAARAFIRTVPPSVRIGLVAFGGYASLLVPPTTERQPLFDALDGLRFIRRTAIGEGLLEAVAALPGRVRPEPDGTLTVRPAGPLPPGVVILLSDGRSNTGIDAVQAAAIARLQQVTVYTVGVGQPQTPDGAWTIGGPLDETELQAIAREAGGKYFRATSAEGLRETYERLARAVGWERRPQEVTGVVGLLGGIALAAALLVSGAIVHRLGIP